MKTILIFLSGMLFQEAFALQIYQVHVTADSESTVQISVITEAVELYYFESWNYEVSNNTITLKACYIPGFGSTIAYLNNTFEIPLTISSSDHYTLIVKAYYITEMEHHLDLQDEMQSGFSIPFTGILGFADRRQINPELALYPNPTQGVLCFSKEVTKIDLYSLQGKQMQIYNPANGIIDLSDFPNGMYCVVLYNGRRRQVQKIILRR